MRKRNRESSEETFQIRDESEMRSRAHHCHPIRYKCHCIPHENFIDLHSLWRTHAAAVLKMQTCLRCMALDAWCINSIFVQKPKLGPATITSLNIQTILWWFRFTHTDARSPSPSDDWKLRDSAYRARLEFLSAVAVMWCWAHKAHVFCVNKCPERLFISSAAMEAKMGKIKLKIRFDRVIDVACHRRWRWHSNKVTSGHWPTCH